MAYSISMSNCPISIDIKKMFLTKNLFFNKIIVCFNVADKHAVSRKICSFDVNIQTKEPRPDFLLFVASYFHIVRINVSMYVWI